MFQLARKLSSLFVYLPKITYMRKLLGLAFLSVILFASCKKDKDATLQGSWNIDNITYKYYINNTLDDTDTETNVGTINFKSDGTAELTYFGLTETSTYVINGNTVNMDGSVFDIQVLTEDNATLYMKETFAAGEYDETFIYLSR